MTNTPADHEQQQFVFADDRNRSQRRPNGSDPTSPINTEAG